MTAKPKSRRFHVWMLRLSTDKLRVLGKALALFYGEPIGAEPADEEIEDAGHLLKDCRSTLAKRLQRASGAKGE